MTHINRTTECCWRRRALRERLSPVTASNCAVPFTLATVTNGVTPYTRTRARAYIYIYVCVFERENQGNDVYGPANDGRAVEPTATTPSRRFWAPPKILSRLSVERKVRARVRKKWCMYKSACKCLWLNCIWCVRARWDTTQDCWDIVAGQKTTKELTWNRSSWFNGSVNHYGQQCR